VKTSILKIATSEGIAKELVLAYDFNAIADAEEPAGCNLLAALESLSDISAMQLRGLLFAAVVSTPKPTILECGELIRVDTIAPITTALADAYNLSIPIPPPAAAAPAAPGPVLVPDAPAPEPAAVAGV
jgi:hypothetical protein